MEPTRGHLGANRQLDQRKYSTILFLVYVRFLSSRGCSTQHSICCYVSQTDESSVSQDMTDLEGEREGGRQGGMEGKWAGGMDGWREGGRKEGNQYCMEIMTIYSDRQKRNHKQESCDLLRGVWGIHLSPCFLLLLRFHQVALPRALSFSLIIEIQN